jgi:HlyD family secretion protein
MLKLSKKTYIAAGSILILLIGGYVHNQNNKTAPELMAAEKRTIVQEVSVTGSVKSAANLQLAFERGGKISAVYAKAGDIVKKGKTLAVLANGDSFAQLQQSQAALDGALARLEEMKLGARPEDLAIYQAKVENARLSLQSAEINLKNVKNKATADIDENYAGALIKADSAVTSGLKALYTISDIQLAHFQSVGAQDEISVAGAKDTAVALLLGQSNAGRWVKEFLSPLNGGAKGTVISAKQNPTAINIEMAVTKTQSAIMAVKAALDAVPMLSDLTTTEITNLASDKTTINAEILTLSTAQQTITVQKSYNNSAISTATSAVNDAQSALYIAELTLKSQQSGYTKQQIAAQEAVVKQAQAAVTNSSALLAKTVIIAPIAGTVSKIDAKVGEIINANAPAISMISENDYQIETNVTEIDLAKIKIGNSADITLDAYGNDVIFNAVITAIDPGETVIDGVPTYKTTLQFVEKDERIKSGMTANISIFTETRENVLSIPQKYVRNKNGQTIVNTLQNGKTVETAITLGLKGADGWVEILDGLDSNAQITY